MTQDARFEDGVERPLYLGALDTEDLKVLSALVQDAVLPATEMTWDRKGRRFALLVNRLRREDTPGASPERVRAVLQISDVLRVATQGIDNRDADTVLSILSLDFEPGEDGAGAVIVTFAGDGAIRIEVEALDAALKDVTKPYNAPSGKVPDHGV